MSVLLEVRDLNTSFAVEAGELSAVGGVSFALDAGRTLCIVGESGCGKSVTALSIMGLVAPPGRVRGEILFEGVDLTRLPAAAMRELRGNRLSMIFQEPMTSLNPALTVGDQIVEGILRHRDVSRAASKEHTIEMLRRVHIPSPESRFSDYPHRLSGGMRQRVMIAMALACEPRLLIADEPTTALDVTIQAQILDLIRELQQRLGLAVILVTHDLGIVAEYADDVTILYAARVMERAPADEIFANPLNPYTRGLLASIPGIDGRHAQRLTAIAGSIPNAAAPPSGCRFHPRCPIAIA